MVILMSLITQHVSAFCDQTIQMSQFRFKEAMCHVPCVCSFVSHCIMACCWVIRADGSRQATLCCSIHSSCSCFLSCVCVFLLNCSFSPVCFSPFQLGFLGPNAQGLCHTKPLLHHEYDVLAEFPWPVLGSRWVPACACVQVICGVWCRILEWTTCSETYLHWYSLLSAATQSCGSIMATPWDH